MKLEHEFYKLPLCFDVECLIRELSAFSDSDWQKHPSDYSGNFSMPLISVNGKINDTFKGPMQATPHLDRSPYIKQVMASFKSVLSRSRLMRLEGQHEVPIHSDINYHWYSRVRIHVPIITTPDVIFHCGYKQVHMRPGEAWIFDSWLAHKVVNPSGSTRVHLVIDTAGSAGFWELVNRAEINPPDLKHRPCIAPEYVSFKEEYSPTLQFERFNFQIIMSPGELDALAEDLLRDAIAGPNDDKVALASFIRTVNDFRRGWRSIWLQHGPEKTGWPEYAQSIIETKQKISENPKVLLINCADASKVLNARILSSAFNPNA